MKNNLLAILILFSLSVCAQRTKYNDDIADYDKQILANPQNPDLYFERAELKEDYLDYKGAVKDYKTCIKKKSKYAAQAYYAMGMMALSTAGNIFAAPPPGISVGYSPANTYFTKAIEIKPDYADAYFQAAKCKFYLGKQTQAIEYFTKSIQLKADLAPEAYYYRGLCKSNSRDKDGACLDFSKAVSLGNTYAGDMRERICR